MDKIQLYDQFASFFTELGYPAALEMVFYPTSEKHVYFLAYLEKIPHPLSGIFDAVDFLFMCFSSSADFSQNRIECINATPVNCVEHNPQLASCSVTYWITPSGNDTFPSKDKMIALVTERVQKLQDGTLGDFPPDIHSDSRCGDPCDNTVIFKPT